MVCNVRGSTGRSMQARLKRGALVVACAAPLLGGCSNGNDSGTTGAVVQPQAHAVGTASMYIVDNSRPTAAHGALPATSSRTLDTTVVYPAEGNPRTTATVGAPLDASAAPYPLIVLSHGLGGTVEYLLPLAKMWAARGYVVALPKFPLTNSATPGGPVAQDVQNQPADVSFIISEVLHASADSDSLLHNAVDGDRIAVSGHSNGAITTYGLIANSCCNDLRVDAAIILSGVPSPFAGGTYDMTNTPPTLVLHGVNDVQLIYNQAVRSYNQLLSPKGLLTLEAGTHLSYLLPADPAFEVTAQATSDFLDGVLRSDGTTLQRLPPAPTPGVATMHWAPDAASNIPVDTLPEPETNRQAFLSAYDNLVDGQTITVTWSGFLPGQVVNIMQCTSDPLGGAAACNISGGKILHPDPEGMGSLELVIRTGPIGNGICDSAHPCVVLVNDASLVEEAAIIRIPITLAD
jgi:dienelactone hydrolase